LSRYTPTYAALQASFEFGSVVGLVQLTLQFNEDAESNLLGFY
jgi:hypothetical protein